MKFGYLRAHLDHQSLRDDQEGGYYRGLMRLVNRTTSMGSLEEEEPVCERFKPSRGTGLRRPSNVLCPVFQGKGPFYTIT